MAVPSASTFCPITRLLTTSDGDGGGHVGSSLPAEPAETLRSTMGDRPAGGVRGPAQVGKRLGVLVSRKGDELKRTDLLPPSPLTAVGR
jgi:hypothetical protein